MIDTQTVKQSVDLRELAAQHTTLSRASATEMEGPCPRCGGSDRFHVKADGWFCRQCHKQWGDAIEYVMWLHSVDFQQAVAMLAGGSVPQGGTPKPKVQRTQPMVCHARANRLVAAAQEALLESDEAMGYLLGRGLAPRTWLQYRLGYIAESPTTEARPAIVIPWYQGDRLTAVRFRYLEPVEVEGRPVKTKSLAGSRFAGVLYGGQALPDYVRLAPHADGRCIERYATLLFVEGEINAMSCWQAAEHTNLHVLSIGSESTQLTPAMQRFAERYGRVLVWADKANVAARQALALGRAYAVRSPDGQDANDLQQAGKLGGFLAAVRKMACKTAEEREALLWDLWDAANHLFGLDSGTAAVLSGMAQEMGKDLPLIEVEPSRWLATGFADDEAQMTGGSSDRCPLCGRPQAICTC